MRLLVSLVAAIFLHCPAWGEERPRAGLLWNRSGLPATLPLIVRTVPGRDHVVFLRPSEGGDPVMAGYIHGGAFFRLLVPPGSWYLSFAHGDEWQEEDILFGEQTEWTYLGQALTFKASVARKQGHIVRLKERHGLTTVLLDKYDLCEVFDTDVTLVPLDEEHHDPNRLSTPALRRLEVDRRFHDRICS